MIKSKNKLFAVKKLNSSNSNIADSGFALIATISIMVLLVMVAIAMLTLSTVELKTSANSDLMQKARDNARMALIMAIGQLQEAAGHDQRVTAAADILDNASEGRAYWTGVWNTNDYDQSKPDDKTFVTWLVSSPDAANIAELSETEKPAGSDDVTIFEGVTDADSVVVPKVQINDGGSNPGAYAYWIEDEGLKADLGWSQADTGDDERNQAMRLASSPGVDHGVFEGPFSNASYPLELDGDNSWLNSIYKTFSLASIPLAAGSSSSDLNWLKENRHHITIGSLGVMSDTKMGGLRRDLSLAFEMDGDADVSANEQPKKFNQQTGEFVGNGDRLSAPVSVPGMPVAERFLYRDESTSKTIFSGDILTTNYAGRNSVSRGPNWWALRDYANLYKRLEGAGGNYTLKARSHYPNVSATSAGNYNIGDLRGNNASINVFDTEYNSGNNYIFRPAAANYSPVLIGGVHLFSVALDNNNLAVGIDSIFYLWNPYNRKMTFDDYLIRLPGSMPGILTLKVTRANGSTQDCGPATPVSYLKGTTASGELTYLVSSLTMDQGEVIVVSPQSASSTNLVNASASPGINLDEESGALITILPTVQVDNEDEESSVYETIPISNSDQISFSYTTRNSNYVGTKVASNSYYSIRTSLPTSNPNAADMSNAALHGDRLQTWDNYTIANSSKSGMSEHYSLPSGLSNSISAAALAGDKVFFGLLSTMIKPANHTGAVNYPMEVFSQFNPTFIENPMSSMWRTCQFNQTMSMIGKNGINSLTTESGIDFHAADPTNGFFGESYNSSTGSTHLPMWSIPSSPLLSLAEFSQAALGVQALEPYSSVGMSYPNVFISNKSIYGNFNDPIWTHTRTVSDSSWLINDALFDRYYLSGMAPEYTITSNGYNDDGGSLEQTLEKFYSKDYKSANANPNLTPYLPDGMTEASIVAELSADDGYKKMGAYSLIRGAFNVNSTSISAWKALLSANRDLEINYSDSGADTASGVPLPSSATPSSPTNVTNPLWSGLARLSDDEVQTLAEKIVEQVKLRSKHGPFMSLSDFINRRVGNTDTATAMEAGALQAAIDAAGINSAVQANAGGVTPNYNFAYFENHPTGNRTTTTGIATDITQAKLLIPLAPKLSARTDTFRIRAYGEVRSADGTKIIAKAMCEAVLQRIPEYMDTEDNPDENKPWDEPMDNPLPMTAMSENPFLNDVNKKFGRKFKMANFRWLANDEI